MQVPGAPSLAFLTYVLIGLPAIAIRSAQRVRAAGAEPSAKPLPSRASMWTSTLLMQGILFAFAFVAGSSFDYEIFALPAIGARELLATAGALAAVFGLRAIVRRLRTDEERRKLIVFRYAPRSAREWALWIATVLSASVAEEAAYRGVGMSILTWSLGNPWIPALLLAAAFGLAHSVQGVKSLLVIVPIALVMHALVAFTGTLVLAMAVHAVFDLVAGFLIAREAARLGVVPAG